MSHSDFFLAIRKPNSGVKYFGPSEKSELRFHFADLEGKKHLRLPVESLDSEPEILWHYQSPQLVPRKDEQLDLYENAIRDMRIGRLDKVVLSRIEDVLYQGEPLDLFRALEQNYPLAAVYLFTHPEVGTWIGASPENLISWENQALKIDSLAGTKSWENRESFDEKEYQEQEIVSNEIEGLLQSFPGITAVHQSPRMIKRAGPLAHLHTEYSATFDSYFEIEKFIDQLHPTPAVAGRPRSAALNYIKEQELYDRRFYTGYFGLESAEAGQFWVNLRCAELCQNQLLSLYVGGGLTELSEPEAEWKETEHKASTILNVLKSSYG